MKDYSPQVTEGDRKGFNIACYGLIGMGAATLLALGGLAYSSNTFRQRISQELWPISPSIENKLNSENINSSSNANLQMTQLLLQTN
ncbi:Uncharacterised protein [uncultured archaeon]|nr:Uncharacterised protein [uncultured archaeon]